MFERILLVGIVVMLSACGASGTFRTAPAGRAESAVPVLAVNPDVRTSTALIEYLNQLHELTPHSSRAAIDMALHEFGHARTPMSTLTLALTLQTLAADAEHANVLRELLATEPALPTGLRTFLSERLGAYDQARRIVRGEIARERRIDQRESILQEETQSAQAEAARLRAALARAEAKIRALTSIEEEIGRSGTRSTEIK